jgi:hypothetical protein
MYDEASGFLEDVHGLPYPLIDQEFDSDDMPNHDNFIAEMQLVEERLSGLLALPDGEERRIVTATLRQRKYGAAAWVAAFHGDMPQLPLDIIDIAKLERANRSLLINRVKWLANGLADGGVFNSAYKSNTFSAPEIQTSYWFPSATKTLKFPAV